MLNLRSLFSTTSRLLIFLWLLISMLSKYNSMAPFLRSTKYPKMVRPLQTSGAQTAGSRQIWRALQASQGKHWRFPQDRWKVQGTHSNSALANTAGHVCPNRLRLLQGRAIEVFHWIPKYAGDQEVLGGGCRLGCFEKEISLHSATLSFINQICSFPDQLFLQKGIIFFKG